jgi:hypothetical protein
MTYLEIQEPDGRSSLISKDDLAEELQKLGIHEFQVEACRGDLRA